MHNHFKINVAKQDGLMWDGKSPRYVHFFAAEVRDEPDAKKVFAELQARFSAPEFSVTVSEWRGSGRTPAWGEHD